MAQRQQEPSFDNSACTGLSFFRTSSGEFPVDLCYHHARKARSRDKQLTGTRIHARSKKVAKLVNGALREVVNVQVWFGLCCSMTPW